MGWGCALVLYSSLSQMILLVNKAETLPVDELTHNNIIKNVCHIITWILNHYCIIGGNYIMIAFCYSWNFTWKSHERVTWKVYSKAQILSWSLWPWPLLKEKWPWWNEILLTYIVEFMATCGPSQPLHRNDTSYQKNKINIWTK